jgi:Flp pilus assembly protein TadG
MSRGRGPGGQSLVEFALILPVLLLILLGLFDFGRAIYAYSSISNAAREGARLAIVDQSSNSGVLVAETEAISQATALGLGPSDVDVTFSCAGVGCIAEVRVRYQFQAITPVIGALIGAIPLEAVVEMPIEHEKT